MKQSYHCVEQYLYFIASHKSYTCTQTLTATMDGTLAGADQWLFKIYG